MSARPTSGGPSGAAARVTPNVAASVTPSTAAGGRVQGWANATCQPRATGAAGGSSVDSGTVRASAGAVNASQPCSASVVSVASIRTASAPAGGRGGKVRQCGELASPASGTRSSGVTDPSARRPKTAVSVVPPPATRFPAARTTGIASAADGGRAYQALVADPPGRSVSEPHTGPGGGRSPAKNPPPPANPSTGPGPEIAPSGVAGVASSTRSPAAAPQPCPAGSATFCAHSDPGGVPRSPATVNIPTVAITEAASEVARTSGTARPAASRTSSGVPARRRRTSTRPAATASSATQSRGWSSVTPRRESRAYGSVTPSSQA